MSTPFRQARIVRDLVSAKGDCTVPHIKDFKRFFETESEGCPQAAEIVSRVLATGDPYIQKIIANGVVDHIINVRTDVPHKRARMLAELVLETWNHVNVANEIGEGPKLSKLCGSGTRFINEFEDKIFSDEYWRGIMALRLIVRSHPYFGAIEKKKFVLPAGAHPDISFVVRTCVERQTLDMDAVNSLYLESNDASPLMSGVL